jgi:membrane protease YdiL (CAAX protease family)
MSRAVAVGKSRVSESSAKTDGGGKSGAPALPGYFEQSAMPFTSLVFLIPLIVVYEVGTRWYASDPVSHVEQRIIAFNIMQNFFNWCGAKGQYMPAAAVVGILLTFHILKRDPAGARSGVLLGMGFESVMYAIPLVTMGYVFQHYLLSHQVADNWRRLLVLSIGAGIYEEMVFRLVLFHLLHMLLVDVLRIPKGRAVPLMVVTSAVLFSLYHYRMPWFPWFTLTGSEVFEWQSFVFRTLAGIYFGMIFMWRGFGLTAGAHASYDILIVVLRLVAQG